MENRRIFAFRGCLSWLDNSVVSDEPGDQLGNSDGSCWKTCFDKELQLSIIVLHTPNGNNSGPALRSGPSSDQAWCKCVPLLNMYVRKASPCAGLPLRLSVRKCSSAPAHSAEWAEVKLS